MSRSAVRLGASIALFSSLAIAFVDASFVRAESPLEFLRQQNRPLFRPPPESLPAIEPRVAPDRRDLHRDPKPRRARTRAKSRPKPRQAAAASQTPTPDLERVVCRRICDGAELALGILRARDKRRDAETMCAAAGGDARTVLVEEKFERGHAFKPPPQLASATGLMAGRAALVPDGADRDVSRQPCPAATSRQRFMMVPILYDATLRYGDIVATQDGYRMFVGKGRPPFDEKDFVDATKRVRKLGRISDSEPVPEASIEEPPDDAHWPKPGAANP